MTRATSARSRRELVEIGELDDRARALRRDEPAEDLLRQLLLRARSAARHVVGVGRERALDAADRAGSSRPSASGSLAIARVPQLRRRELQQRQRAGRAGERVEHVVDHRGRLEPVADHLDRLDRAPRASPRRSGACRNTSPRDSSSMNRGSSPTRSRKSRAHRHDDAQRRGRVVGDARERGGERAALVGIGDERVELLELIDEQQQLAVRRAARGCAAACRGSRARCAAARSAARARPSASARRCRCAWSSAGRCVASAASGWRPGRSVTTSQRSPLALSAGPTPARMNDDLPTPDGPTIAGERQLADARDHARDIAAAAEEPIGVGLLERGQAGIRALALGELAAVAAGQQLLEPAHELGRARRSARPCACAGSRSTSAISASGRCGAASRSDGIGSSLIAFVISASVVSGSTDACPSSISNNMMPTAQMSERVIDLAHAHLLGRHVRQRADHRALARQVQSALRRASRGRRRAPAPRSSRAERLRDAEVEHLDLARARHEHVLGLEIAVDDAELVRAGERARDRQHQLDDARRRQQRAAPNAPIDVAQRLALEELEHHVRHALELVDLVDDHDVLVIALRGRARLDEEPLGDRRASRAAGT